jgi:L-ascorbate metabolism protein UlaG (beta-lactamase superfamily)
MVIRLFGHSPSKRALLGGLAATGEMGAGEQARPAGGRSDQAASAAVTYVGHATVLIEAGEARFLTDPLLRGRVGHLRRVASFLPPPAFAAPDGVLISHAHHDHLDLPSLRSLAPSALGVVPRGWGALLGRAGFDDVVEVEAGDRVAVAGVDVLVTDAEHDGRRLPVGRPSPAVGYMIESDARIYFAGDTDLFDGMGDLAGEVAVALLPVAGWGRRLPRGHLDPERAAQAAALVRPSVAVPIHWGTFTPFGIRHPPAEAAPREFARLTRRYAPGVDVRVLEPGERLAI